MASTGDTWRLGRPSTLAWVRGVRLSALAPVAVALFPVVLVLIATSNGLGMSYDSVVYASTRRELLETGEWSFSPLWPIGYPAILAVIGTGAGAVAFSCVTLWANLLVSYRLALEVTGSRWASLLVLCWLSASPATVSVFSMMWSEAPFCLAVNVAVLALVKLHKARHLLPGWTGALIVSVCVAGVLRFAALALLPTVAVALLLALQLPLGRRLMSVAAVTAASSLGFVVSVARNLLLGADLTGPRLPAQYDLADVAVQLPQVAAAFVTNDPDAGSVALGAAVILAAVTALAVWVRSLPVPLRHPVVPLVVIAGGYVAFLVASIVSTYIDPLNFRLLSPIQPAIAVILAAACNGLLAGRFRRVALVAGCVYLALILPLAAGWATMAHRGGIAQEVAAAQYPDLAAVVAATIPADARIVADWPSIFVLLTGRDAVVGFPDAGPIPAGPSYIPEYPLRQATPGRYVVTLSSTDQDHRGWELVHRADSFAIYRVAQATSK